MSLCVLQCVAPASGTINTFVAYFNLQRQQTESRELQAIPIRYAELRDPVCFVYS